MKQGHKKLALLGTVLIALFLAGQALASGLDGASEPDASVRDCRYYYWLEDASEASGESGTGTWRYKLYVERTDPEGYLLHTGYIALAAETDTLSFAPAPGWNLLDEPETGTFEDSVYISFGWIWGENANLEDSKEGTNRQLLGTLTVQADTQPELEDIDLLEWYNTQTGSRQIQEWQDAVAQANGGDTSIFPEDYLEVIDNTWRFDEPTSYDGYYQGYYDPPDDWDQTKRPREDLTPGWQGFRIGAYAPERPITLEFCNPTTGEVIAKAVNPTKAGIGHFKTRINFGELTYTDKDGAPKDEGWIPNDTYTLKISKYSHVTCTIPNLTFDEGGMCTRLLGVYIELPCGDVDGDGDIQQDDRANLTEPGMYRSKATADETQGPTPESCDLDGDRRVDQTDLAILIAPANYGKQDFTYPRR